MRTFTNKKAVPVKQTAKQKLQYVRKNWQLYLFFLMPALLLTIIFKYIPMSGVLIAFEDYNVIDGVFGSEWVGLEYFQRFLSSPDFMNYLMNTLKLSAYGLLWGFPVPIILALLLNRIRKAGIRKKIQLLIYAPNFMEVDRTCCGVTKDVICRRIWKVTEGKETLKLRFILDRQSIELFVNDGEQVVTTAICTPMEADEIMFSCDGKAKVNVEKYEIVV